MFGTAALLVVKAGVINMSKEVINMLEHIEFAVVVWFGYQVVKFTYDSWWEAKMASVSRDGRGIKQHEVA